MNMTNTIQLEPAYSVGEAINLADVDQLICAGFRTIVCFRPDNESTDQTPFRAIGAYASARGIQAVHLPVAPGVLDDGVTTSLQLILDTCPAPIFGFCKTGMRAASAWALSKRTEIKSEEILKLLYRHGFKSFSLEQRLRSR